jgi:methionyl-tRNA formyltransferase
MVRGLDAGPVLCQRETPILPDDTAGSLEERLSREAAVLLEEALELLKIGSFRLQEQDARLVTLAPKLTKEDGRLPWAEDAETVARYVRAMQPWPRAFSFLLRQSRVPERVLILKAHAIAGEDRGGDPGTVIAVTDEALEVACGTGRLAVTYLQIAGGKAMTTRAFLRGRQVKAGDRLGDG